MPRWVHDPPKSVAADVAALCAYLPILGILTFFLPNIEPIAEQKSA